MLIGTELYGAVRDERSGLRFDTWAMELADRAAKRLVDAVRRDDDSWRGLWWLLHGLASIDSYGLGAYAWEQASTAPTRRWPCFPNGCAGTASRPGHPLP